MSREKQLSAPIATAAAKQDAWQELQPLLDQELSLLPEKYRAVLVLCDLEGRTQKEAAAHLKVPEGTVAGWRARARVMLAKRLARRGLVAIQAQGGEAKVAKLRTMRIKVEGTINLVPGQPAIPFVIEDWWQMPDQYKTTSRFEFGGKKVNQTKALDGDTGWMQFDGMAQDMPKEAVAEMREQKYAEDLDRLGFLKDKGIDLTALGQSKVDRRAVVGVLIKSKGHRDVKLWFDKESGLLAKREHRVLDSGTGKKVTQEVVFSDYRETDGVNHYRTLTAYRDGKKIIEAKVREIELFDKLDKKVFAKP